MHRTPGVAAVKMVKRRGLYELSIENYITHLYARIAYPAWIWNFPTWNIWTRKDGKSSENGLPHSWHASGRNDWRLCQYADIARYLRWTLFLQLFMWPHSTITLSLALALTVVTDVHHADRSPYCCTNWTEQKFQNITFVFSRVRSGLDNWRMTLLT